jgi:hypothetical protein
MMASSSSRQDQDAAVRNQLGMSLCARDVVAWAADVIAGATNAGGAPSAMSSSSSAAPRALFLNDRITPATALCRLPGLCAPVPP